MGGEAWRGGTEQEDGGGAPAGDTAVPAGFHGRRGQTSPSPDETHANKSYDDDDTPALAANLVGCNSSHFATAAPMGSAAQDWDTHHSLVCPFSGKTVTNTGPFFSSLSLYVLPFTLPLQHYSNLTFICHGKAGPSMKLQVFLCLLITSIFSLPRKSRTQKVRECLTVPSPFKTRIFKMCVCIKF